MIPLIISPTCESISDSELHKQIQQLSRNFRIQAVDENDLKKIGLILWKIANRASDFSKFSNSHALIIQSDDAAVQNLPWEYLYHPEHGFLGKHPDFTLSRCLPNAQKMMPSINASPLKILHFTAQPDDLKTDLRLEIEREQHCLETALNPFIQSGQIYFHSPNDGRFPTLKNLVQEYWHLVILTGHSFSGESPCFLFENEMGHSHIISVEILAQTFKNQQVQCVVLSACESGKNGSNNNSLAIQCFQAGVPHVIGMRESLMDRAGSVFVQAFCESLVKKMHMDVAVQQGRCAMNNLLKYNEKWRDSKTDPSVGQWSLPVLFSCAPSQILFAEIPFNPPLLKEVKPQIKLSDIFIGRRRELRILMEKLSQGKIKKLLIRGEAGIGKTAFSERLVKNLSKLNYKTINYQSKIPDNSDLADKLLILLTSRRSVPQMTDFYEYELAPPHFNDFYHYAYYLGLPYKTFELRLIYQALNGNFKGLQLLQTIQSVKTLKKQLVIVKRYLVAYSRESR